MIWRRARNRASDPGRSYEDDGYAIFRGVVDAGIVRQASEHVTRLQAEHPELRPEQFGLHLAATDPFWLRLVANQQLLDVAEQFIGSNIALFATHFLSKPPLDGQPVLWHQDGSYWPLEPMDVVSLWLAIDDSTPENGCMRVIPGSHRSTLQEMRDRTDVPNVLSSEIDPGLVDEKKAVELILRAGDVSVHHPNLIHGSKPNTSSRRRCGLTIRYIPTTTRIVTTPWPCAFLLRGSAVEGVNEYLPLPT